MEGGAAAKMLERRWFAAFNAASTVHAECEALVEALQMTEAAWNAARKRLVKLELLRDALGEELAELDGQKEDVVLQPAESGQLSAA